MVTHLSYFIDLILFLECRQTPLQVIHIFGNFMRIWSIYSVYRYLSQTGASVVLFIFSCLVPSSILFLFLQKPWKGRPLSNTQVIIKRTASFYSCSSILSLNLMSMSLLICLAFLFVLGSAFFDKWWYNCSILHLMGKGA